MMLKVYHFFALLSIKNFLKFRFAKLKKLINSFFTASPQTQHLVYKSIFIPLYIVFLWYLRGWRKGGIVLGARS